MGFDVFPIISFLFTVLCFFFFWFLGWGVGFDGFLIISFLFTLLCFFFFWF